MIVSSVKLQNKALGDYYLKLLCFYLTCDLIEYIMIFTISAFAGSVLKAEPLPEWTPAMKFELY